MRELGPPPGIEGDESATEMIRVWLAHSQQHVSLLLGMWEDAEDKQVDERDAWGFLLADLTRHIANGLNQSHNWPVKSTVQWIRQSYLQNLADDDHEIEGEYVDEE